MGLFALHSPFPQKCRLLNQDGEGELVRGKTHRIFLALGVGWGLAGALETGLLALLDTRVAGQETSPTHRTAQFGIDLEQCAGQTKLDRGCLSCNAATRYMDGYVIGGFQACQTQRGSGEI